MLRDQLESLWKLDFDTQGFPGRLCEPLFQKGLELAAARDSILSKLEEDLRSKRTPTRSLQ